MPSAFVDRGFENQIHVNETGHAALTKSRITARILSPVGPAAIQIGFQVIAPHTPTVTNVEIAILLTLASDEGSVRNGALLAAKLSDFCTNTGDRRTAVVVPITNRNRFLRREMQKRNHRPMTLPIASAPL